jgi:hypothetical protein
MLLLKAMGIVSASCPNSQIGCVARAVWSPIHTAFFLFWHKGMTFRGGSQSACANKLAKYILANENGAGPDFLFQQWRLH